MKKILPVSWITMAVAAAPFLLGGFFEWVSCLSSIVLAAILLCRLRGRKVLEVASGLTFWAVALLPVSYLFTTAWAQDKGMALPGFFKYLPVFLFALAVWQEHPKDRAAALEAIPWSGAVMVAVCTPLSFLPSTDGYLLVAGRQAGMFEYPNTYALFLLLGLLVLATRECHRWYHWPVAAALLTGIFLSGSRSVFLLLAVSAVAVAVLVKKPAVRLSVLIALPTAVAAVVIYAAASGGVGAAGRFLTTTLHSSTWLGRLLYAKDAFPVILRHPLGLGYHSYSYMQGSFQTGVYQVQAVHNDLLQLMLDAGWIPAILMVAAVMCCFFRKGQSLRCRLLLTAICAHGLLDFSLQYLSILLILTLLLCSGPTKKISLQRRDVRFLRTVCGVLAALSLYFGAVSGLSYLQYYHAAIWLNPCYTDSLVTLMYQGEHTNDALQYARRVLALNRYVARAYRIEAVEACRQGDYQAMADNQRKAIVCGPYDLTSYTGYIDLLEICLESCQRAGDNEGIDFCRQELCAIPGMLRAVETRTSALGWSINDKPQLTLPAAYQAKTGGAP